MNYYKVVCKNLWRKFRCDSLTDTLAYTKTKNFKESEREGQTKKNLSKKINWVQFIWNTLHYFKQHWKYHVTVSFLKLVSSIRMGLKPFSCLNQESVSIYARSLRNVHNGRGNRENILYHLNIFDCTVWALTLFPSFSEDNMARCYHGTVERRKLSITDIFSAFIVLLSLGCTKNTKRSGKRTVGQTRTTNK